MAELADGTYYVYSGYGSNLVLDVAHGNRSNGANVQVYAKDATDNQVWLVTTRSDGSRQITSRFTGKSIDVAGDKVTTAGANVQMWTDNDKRSQSWDIADTGGTMTVGGTSYPLYKVTLTAAPTMAMELLGNSGFQSGTNTCIAGYTGASDQKWAFVPVPKLRSGGVYELVLRLDSHYALDVHSGSNADCANIILTGRHGANDHKWYVTEESDDKWLLRNIASGKYAQVAHGTATDLANVEQYRKQNKPRELWKPVSFGTMTIDGKECEIVKLYSWVDGAGDTFVMDANQNSKLNLGNICICHTDATDEGQYSQEWALYPTTATDPNMAIPTELGWSDSVGGSDWSPDRASADVLYPTWRCASAWATPGPNHYEWRLRKRNLRATTSTTTAWGDWTAWETALVTTSGQRSWVTEGLPATYDESTYKDVEYQIQVRTVGVEETAAVVGCEASQVLRAFKEPDTTLSNAGFSPDGLRMDYTSSYTAGTNQVIIRRVTLNGKNVLKSNWRSPDLDSSTSVLLPADSLTTWPEDGDTVIVMWHNANDQIADFAVNHFETLQVSQSAASGVTLEPVVTVAEGRTLQVEVSPTADHESVYIRANGETMRVGGDAEHTYSVEYPFGSDIDLWVATSSGDSDRWAIWHRRYASGAIGNKRPAHAWNWDGGSFVLELREGTPLETHYDVQTTHEALALDSRPWQAVRFGASAVGTLSAEGVVSEALGTEGTRQALEELRLQGHVRYRSPHGLHCDVAVTGYSLTCLRGIWTVSIEMTRETI